MSRPVSPEGASAMGAGVPASGSLLCIDIPGVVVRREPMGPGWQAHAEGEPAQWARGDSQDEAIGGLIRRLALEFEGANWRRATAPPPAGPASPLPAAEIAPQAGGQGPESSALAFAGSLEGPGIVVREIFGGWRWREREASLNIFTPEDWSLPYATEGAARAGAREAVAAAFRLRAAEAKAAELAVEVERLAALAEIHAEDAEDWNLPATARASKARAAAAHALLARLGFRPGQL